MTRLSMLRTALVAMVLLTGCGSHDAPAAGAGSAGASASAPATGPRRSITVDAMGYHPATMTVPAGAPITLVFTRTSDDGCGQQLVFPSLGIRRDLPLDEPVEVSITPPRGELTFTCGMNMYRGSVVAQ